MILALFPIKDETLMFLAKNINVVKFFCLSSSKLHRKPLISTIENSEKLLDIFKEVKLIEIGSLYSLISVPSSSKYVISVIEKEMNTAFSTLSGYKIITFSAVQRYARIIVPAFIDILKRNSVYSPIVTESHVFFIVKYDQIDRRGGKVYPLGYTHIPFFDSKNEEFVIEHVYSELYGIGDTNKATGQYHRIRISRRLYERVEKILYSI